MIARERFIPIVKQEGSQQSLCFRVSHRQLAGVHLITAWELGTYAHADHAVYVGEA